MELLPGDRSEEDFEAPYPLKSYFLRYVLPGFMVLMVILALLINKGSIWLTHEIYLQISAQRVETIDRAMREHDEQAWIALRNSSDPRAFLTTAAGKSLKDRLADEIRELGLPRLKLYGPDALVIYSSRNGDIGSGDPSEAWKEASHGEGMIVHKTEADGRELYELYIAFPSAPLGPPWHRG